MIWLLTLFRSIALAMKRAGVLTGDTAEDRRVFLRTVAALGGSAALGQLVGGVASPSVVSRVPAAFRELITADLSALVKFSFDGLFTRDVAVATLLQETAAVGVAAVQQELEQQSPEERAAFVAELQRQTHPMRLAAYRAQRGATGSRPETRAHGAGSPSGS